MNCHRLGVILFPQAHHLIALRSAQFIGCPLTWTGRENLERIAAQPIGTFSCILDPTGARRMNANAARGQPGRAPWYGQLEYVLLLRHRTGHEQSITSPRNSVGAAFGRRFAMHAASTVDLILWR